MAEAGGLITGSSFHRGMYKKTVPLGYPKKDGRVKDDLGERHILAWLEGKVIRSYSIGYGKTVCL